MTRNQPLKALGFRVNVVSYLTEKIWKKTSQVVSTANVLPDLGIGDERLGNKLRQAQKRTKTGWWFQPVWKICSSNWTSSPNRGENKKYLKTPPKRLPTYWLTALQATRFEPSWQHGCISLPPNLPLGTVGSRPLPAFFDGRQLPPGATRFRKSEIPWKILVPFSPLGRCRICSNPTFACNKFSQQPSDPGIFLSPDPQNLIMLPAPHTILHAWMPLIQYKWNEKPLLNKCALSCSRDLRRILCTSSSLAQPSMDRSRPFFLPTSWDLNVFLALVPQQILLHLC